MLIIGYPKSGNTWFCFLLAYCLNAPFDNLMEPGIHPRDEYQRKLVKGGLSHKSYIDIVKGVWSTHDYSTFLKYLNNDFTIYLVRDGRDVLVSYYYYLNKFLASEQKTEKRKSTFAKLLHNLKESDSKRFSAFIREKTSEWTAHVTKCKKQKPDALIRYEDINKSPNATLENIFSKLGVEVESTVIDSAIESFSFRKLSGREQGKENQASFFRKGIVGDWKNKFSKSDSQYVKEVAGNLLIELGYENDLNW